MRPALGLFFVLFSSVSFAQTKVSDCSLEQTVLRKAQGNHCFNQLMVKATDVDDRRWLLELQKTWNPSKDLKIVRVPGGILALHGKKLLLDARWVLNKPPTISWNGKIKVAAEPASPSLKKYIDQLIAQSPDQASLWSMAMPLARANEDTEARHLFMLYTIHNGPPMNAYQFFSSFKDNSKFFPEVSFIERHFTGKNLKCTANGGIQSITYDFNTESAIHGFATGRSSSLPIVIKPLSATRFEVQGAFGASGDKKMIAEYQALPDVSDQTTRVYNAQTSTSQGEDPSLKGDAKPQWRFKYTLCEDTECKARREIQDYQELQSRTSKRMRYRVPVDLEQALIGSSVLANCCTSRTCREAAQFAGIDLEVPKKGSGVK